MASLSHHARRHPGLTWLAGLALVAGFFQVIGAEMMDGGIGSFGFVIFAIVAAPFLLAGRMVTALMSGAPVALQVIAVVIACLGVALLLNRPLRTFLPEPAEPPGG